MIFSHSYTHYLFQRLPLLGSALFMLLYIIASFYYPGGTYLDKSTGGFDWAQNYWCNLLNEKAINGQPNPARPFAIAGMLLLSFTMITFWYLFSFKPDITIRERYIIRIAGFMAMAVGCFIFTGYHDTVINVAGFFGLVALAGTLHGLKRLRWTSCCIWESWFWY